MKIFVLLTIVFPATMLLAGPDLSRVPLHFEPGARKSEFTGRAGALSVLITPDGAAIAQGSIHLVDSRRSAPAQPEDLLPGYSNYLLARDPAKWRTHVPNYGRVRYRNVYPGIDVVYYGSAHELEFDFIVAPGADPRRIRLALSNPDLHIRLPRVYQKNHTIGGRVVRDGNILSFDVAAYDRSQPLIIDPVLSYAAVLGGGGVDEGRAIAVDASGSAYIVGNAFDGNFPVVNGQSGRYSFLAKLNPVGNSLAFSTYLPWQGGGPSSYAVDSSGAAYFTRDGAPDMSVAGRGPGKCGTTGQPGGPDVYVAKLASDGTSLVYAGCLGGSLPEYPAAIAVDRAGNAYVTGFTQSADFPLVNPVQSSHPDAGGFLEGFVLKLGPDGTVLYSTFLGGGHGDFPTAIAADAIGNAYITGQTSSPDFPLKNAIQTQLKGPASTQSAFVAKINADGSKLVFSTYLGGSNGDIGLAIAADAAGNAYVAGRTTSGDFPTTANALQRQFNGVFALKTTDAAASWKRSDSGLPGSASSVRVDPNHPSNIYAVSSGRIFKSSDSGGTWRAAIGDSVAAIWIDPVDSTLFASMLSRPGFSPGEVAGAPALLRSRDGGASFTTLDTGLSGLPGEMVFDSRDANVIYGRWGGGHEKDGLFKSIDGGDTWKPTGLSGPMTGSGPLSIDPVNSSILYAVARNRGLLQSSDGGETWTTIDAAIPANQLLVDSNSRLYAVGNGAIFVKSGDSFIKKSPPGNVTTLAIDPTDSSTWYAITFVQPNFLGPVSVQSGPPPPSSVLYKSSDEGDHWQPVNNGIPNLTQITSLAFDPSSPGAVYLGLIATSDAFFTKLSADGMAMNYSTYLGGSSQDAVTAIAVDTQGNAYLTGTSSSTDFPTKQAFRTSGSGFVSKFDTNGVLAWSSLIGAASPNALALAPSGDLYLTGSTSSAALATPFALQQFDPSNLFRSTDSGASWSGTTISPVPTAPFVAPLVVVDPKTPSRVFALLDRLFVSNDRGQSWTQLGAPAELAGFPPLALILDPVNPMTMYAASGCFIPPGGMSVCGVSKSTDRGTTWTVHPIMVPAPTAPPVAGQPASLAGLAIDPKTTSNLYAAVANGGIYKSTDAGETWSPSGSLLSANAVAVDPLNPAIVYASTGNIFQFALFPPPDSWGLYKSTDAGATWTPINKGLPSRWFASILMTDPAVRGRVYAVGSFNSGGVYRSDDGGNNWMKIGGGLPDWAINAVAIDPANSAILYSAPSSGGLYRSTDAGATWQVMPALRIPIVNSIAIDPSGSSRIFAGTQVDPQDVFVMKISP